MGGPVATTRGGMVHTVLRLCCAFEDALTKAIDGGKDGEQQCTWRVIDQHCRHIAEHWLGNIGAQDEEDKWDYTLEGQTETKGRIG